MGTGDIMPGGNLASELASHPGGSSNTLSRFMLRKPAVWLVKTLPYPVSIYSVFCRKNEYYDI